MQSTPLAVSQIPNPRRKKRLILLIALSLAVLALVPFPLRLTSKDKERAVSHALETLARNRRALTNRGYSHLYDTDFVKDTNHVYFENALGISDTVFLEHGLKPIPTERKLDVDKGDVLVSFSNRDIRGKSAANIQFSYVFGSTGAQGYEIRIYRTLLGRRYFVYVHRWVS